MLPAGGAHRQHACEGSSLRPAQALARAAAAATTLSVAGPARARAMHAGRQAVAAADHKPCSWAGINWAAIGESHGSPASSRGARRSLQRSERSTASRRCASAGPLAHGLDAALPSSQPDQHRDSGQRAPATPGQASLLWRETELTETTMADPVSAQLARQCLIDRFSGPGGCPASAGSKGRTRPERPRWPPPCLRPPPSPLRDRVLVYGGR